MSGIDERNERWLNRTLIANVQTLLCAFGLALVGCSKPAPAPHASPTAAVSDEGWWRSAVVYEIYPRSFQDSDGDGVGDLNGITQRLDYLADLGVDAIWITPFFQSPQVDFGYDVSSFVDIDPRFGTLADFDRLIAAAHARHIRVLADLVLNHTSDQHPWFVESRSSRQSPKRDFYVWHDPVNGGPPNHWASIFEPSAWTLDEKTGQYYYHAFYAAQPDLNWRNPKVESAMFDAVRFWLDRGVDGFRLDAVRHMFEDQALHDNPLTGGLRPGSTTEPDQEHVYTVDQPEIHPVLQRMRQVLDRYKPERILIGEAYVPTPDKLVDYYGPHDNELQLPFNFFLMQVPKLDAGAFRAAVVDSERALAGHWTTWVLSNHDKPRHRDRYGDGVHDELIARELAALLLTLPGTPFLYYGEEIGMVTTEPRSVDEVQDPVGKRYWPGNKGRDGERTPMQWTTGNNAGFSTGTPWLRLAPDATQRNVELESRDRRSLLSFYRDLIKVRRASPALRDGELVVVGNDPNVFAYLRKTSAQTVLVALDMSAEPQAIDLPPGTWRVLADSSGEAGRTLPAGKLELSPFQAIVVELAR